MPTSRCTVTQDDGWGHTLENTTIADDMRELKGYLDGTDKHEQVMSQLEQQVQAERNKRQQ